MNLCVEVFRVESLYLHTKFLKWCGLVFCRHFTVIMLSIDLFACMGDETFKPVKIPK